MSLKFKQHIRSFRLSRITIFNVILYAFYELNEKKRQLHIKRI